MKRNLLKVAALLLLGITIAGCASRAPAQKAGSDPGPVIGPLWYLREIRSAAAVITLDRPALEAEGLGDVFSLRFRGDDLVSGKAAPNVYTAPCTWGDDHTLAIGALAVTRMFAFKEPEALKEAEFLDRLSRVSRWAHTPPGQLELYLADDQGLLREVMVFDLVPEAPPVIRD